MFDIIIIQGSNQFPWKDVLISVGVPLIVAFMSWWGNRSAVKIIRESLDIAKEATPPELLRLEKWSTILTDSKNYPKNIKRELDVNTIQSTYNAVLKRATLENRVMNLGILNMRIRRELSSLYKVSVGDKYYARPEWGGPRVNIKKQSKIILVFLIITSLVLDFIFPIFLAVYYGKIDFLNIGLIIVVYLVPFMMILYGYSVIKKTYNNLRMMNIVFRNGYHALKDIYLIRNYEGVQETPKENKEREDFEKTKEYKEWRDKVKKDHPDWSSWNYGLSINWDNRPYKNNTNGLEPNHLPSSLFRAEDLKRQEP